MLNFYTVIVLDVVSFMALLVFMANTNDLFSRHKKKQFTLLFLSVVLGILTEWSGSVAVAFGGEFREVVVWTKMVELSVTPVVPFLCAEVLRQAANAPRRRFRLAYLLIVHAGLEFLSAFGGFIYYVDANGVFHHGPFYWIYLVTYVGVSVYVLRAGYRVSSLYQGKNKTMLICMLGLLALGIVANQMDRDVKSAWLTVAIVVSLFYIFYNDMLQRLDAKTMLLSYASYNNMLSRLRKPTMIEILNIDSFRAVNEEHGSAYGDQCLRTVAGVMRKVYGRHGACCRVRNDEFCVILDGDEAAVVALNDQFLAALEECRKADPHLPRVSLGYACYDPSCEDVQDAERAMAAALYRNKERNKIKHGPVDRSASAPSAPQNQASSFAHEEAAEAEHPTLGGLDVSGLTDRTFAAFASTSERNYIFLCNMDTGVSRWSLNAVQYFDLPSEYMFEGGWIWESRIHPHDRQMYHDDIESVFSGRSQAHNLEYRVKNRLGEYVVCTCRGVVLKGDGEDPDYFAGTISNHGIIDEVDSITGLHVGAEFTKSIRRLIDERASACVVEVGIDNFPHVNAMYGQEGGNRILQLFGVELRDLVAGRGQAFRLEGVKFAFYLHDAGPDEARELFRHLRLVAQNETQIGNLRVPLRIYGGAVQLGPHCSDSESLVCSNLIYAMEQSLENYRNELVFSEDVCRTVNIENVQLHAEIHRSAMDGCKNFFLCYQPIVSFETGKVIGAEALLRYRQKSYGVVPPDNFIPWLENDPAFIPVGNWILRQAIRETKALRQEFPDFILNVNIADSQLKYDNFREDVLNVLTDEECPPENLCLELTERCRRMSPDFLKDELRFFRSRGIAIALDDFGTGMSSLALLLQLPVDELKVDRVFLLSALVSERGLYLLETIIRSAREAGLHTCVEGVETADQCALVASLAGDYYQGYYSSKPVPIEAFEAFCHENWGQ
ncbi:EAL domain-containing protein [Xiamenia xianingshaonis]|uniref:EAL domain-containing protein n=1 Tax=Xiamenia xianingshaonis TaxID=2682776 RepID=A0ABX0IH80_9ACTN|nr:EAL domain-containing protein [Xiamenia xianingshaonis]NHM13578.1 EAL domain-containing protein [Xiamenia xianingshaonis]